MIVANPYDLYRQNAVLNAKPEQLVVMLYDGALKFIRQADQALTKKDIPGAHQALVRTQDIVTHLRAALNEDYEITRSLDALYAYIYNLLVQANVKKDRDVLAIVARLMRELREAWVQALKAKPDEASQGSGRSAG
jgi:flagellar protein FliS